MSERTKWFEDARFGMFIHWGIYAIPARASRSEWIRSVDRVTDEEYQEYFDTFNPVDYDPKKWARLAKEAGMKYAVLTTKHHDGFCLFDSKYTDFKSTNTPCGRDLVREYVDAFRSEGIKVGFYYSLIDWHHPDYPAFNDAHHPMRGNENYKHYGEHFERYIEYMHNQVRELMTSYGKIDILWFDFHYDDMTGGIGEQSAKVNKILQKYKNVVYISGHIHNGLSNADTKAKLGYESLEKVGNIYSLNIPAINGFNENGDWFPGSSYAIEVYDDEIVLRARNFMTGLWRPEYNYIIPLS